MDLTPTPRPSTSAAAIALRALWLVFALGGPGGWQFLIALSTNNGVDSDEVLAIGRR